MNDCSPEIAPVLKSLYGMLWSADLLLTQGRPMPHGKKRARAPWGPPG